MTASEWIRTFAEIKVIWPGNQDKLSDATRAAWFALLQDLPGDDVRGAVQTLALEARPFPPAVGEIRQRVIDAAQPTAIWAEVWAELNSAALDYGHHADPEAINWTTPAIADLVAAIGWSAFCTSEDPPGVLEAQCRRAWEQLAARRRRTATENPQLADRPPIALLEAER